MSTISPAAQSTRRTPGQRRRVILLGCTGSIGTNTCRVVENLAEQFELVGLAAGRKCDELIAQAKKFGVKNVALADESAAQIARRELPGAKVFSGDNASEQLVRHTDAEVLVAAIVGAAGLPATVAAIERGMDIALANKETLVAAGELVVPLTKKMGVHLLPVDSEHSAIFQCLQTADPRENGRSVKKIILTASGGPFRTAPLEKIRSATVDEALAHPTWKMGPKITIDSATMMNKAMEIIEAHWLFGLRGDQIDVIIHPQSIAHSFVEFTDHSILAQLGSADMKTPIQYALTWPSRSPGCSTPLDWRALKHLDFEQPDDRRFPSLKLAYKVIERGGTAGAVLNAANEAAVAAFLDKRISFGQIVELAAAALDAIPVRHIQSLATVLEADRAARQFVEERIG
jgi:1-deoxy-D-xylulose-5-phosphate reductoisomerase